MSPIPCGISISMFHDDIFRFSFLRYSCYFFWLKSKCVKYSFLLHEILKHAMLKFSFSICLWLLFVRSFRVFGNYGWKVTPRKKKMYKFNVFVLHYITERRKINMEKKIQNDSDWRGRNFAAQYSSTHHCMEYKQMPVEIMAPPKDINSFVLKISYIKTCFNVFFLKVFLFCWYVLFFAREKDLFQCRIFL